MGEGEGAGTLSGARGAAARPEVGSPVVEPTRRNNGLDREGLGGTTAATTGVSTATATGAGDAAAAGAVTDTAGAAAAALVLLVELANTAAAYNTNSSVCNSFRCKHQQHVPHGHSETLRRLQRDTLPRHILLHAMLAPQQRVNSRSQI